MRAQEVLRVVLVHRRVHDSRRYGVHAYALPCVLASRDGLDAPPYTGATAIMRRWAEAADCPTAGPERPFDAGYPQADCRSYCDGDADHWPMVLDCRSPMGHEYGWDWSWKLVLDFFDRH